MDTMDELRDAVRRFVGAGKVVSIEEGNLLRLVAANEDGPEPSGPAAAKREAA